MRAADGVRGPDGFVHEVVACVGEGDAGRKCTGHRLVGCAPVGAATSHLRPIFKRCVRAFSHNILTPAPLHRAMRPGRPRGYFSPVWLPVAWIANQIALAKIYATPASLQTAEQRSVFGCTNEKLPGNVLNNPFLRFLGEISLLVQYITVDSTRLNLWNVRTFSGF